MNIKLQIKMLCAACDINQRELARRLGTSQQNLSAKMKRGTFTTQDLEKIALAVGAEYKGLFILPDGTEI